MTDTQRLLDYFRALFLLNSAGQILRESEAPFFEPNSQPKHFYISQSYGKPELELIYALPHALKLPKGIRLAQTDSAEGQQIPKTKLKMGCPNLTRKQDFKSRGISGSRAAWLSPGMSQLP